jgi:hypothetical protein
MPASSADTFERLRRSRPPLLSTASPCISLPFFNQTISDESADSDASNSTDDPGAVSAGSRCRRRARLSPDDECVTTPFPLPSGSASRCLRSLRKIEQKNLILTGCSARPVSSLSRPYYWHDRCTRRHRPDECPLSVMRRVQR